MFLNEESSLRSRCSLINEIFAIWPYYGLDKEDETSAEEFRLWALICNVFSKNLLKTF